MKRPYQMIGEKLRSELLKGRYQVGDRLAPERDIAERLSVSRAVVRDAMIMLELENLVEVRKGSGIYVVNIPATVFRSSLESADDGVNRQVDISPDMGVFEMLQARQLVESHIAEFAATRLTKNDMMKLKSALDAERQALVSGTDNEEGDKAFHLAIAEATQNGALVDIAKRLWVQRRVNPSWAALHNRLSSTSYREKWLGQHQMIFDALKKKDAGGAKRAMWAHLESVKQTLLELSDADDPSFDGYLFDSYTFGAN